MRNTQLATVLLMAVSLAGTQLAFAHNDHDDDDSEASVFSASAVIQPSPDPGPVSAFLAEVPKGSTFLLTQYCAKSTALEFPGLVGSDFGPVPADERCTTYTPGVLLEGGQALSCVMPFSHPGPLPCMITGYMRRK